MKTLISALIVAALGVVPASASAALSYAFAFEATSVQALPGATVGIDLYLVETVTGADTSLIVADGGLFGAIALVERDDVAGLNDPAIISGAYAHGGPDEDPTAWDSPDTPTPTATKVSFILTDLNGSTLVTGEAVAAQTRRVKLGTIEVTVGDEIGEVTNFIAADPDAGADNDVVTAFSNIDGDFGIDPDAVAVEVIIPEPATLALVALGGVALIRRRAR